MGDVSGGPVVTFVSGWVEEKYECEWRIQNLLEIAKSADSQNKTDLSLQKLILPTRRNSPLYSKWAVDVKRVRKSQAFEVICQLDKICGKETTELRASFRVQLRLVDRSLKDVGEVHGQKSMNDRVLNGLRLNIGLNDHQFVDSDGTVTLFLTLRLFKPCIESSTAEQLRVTMYAVEKRFSEKSEAMCARNLAYLVDLESKEFDMTMVCSDGKRLKCHKVVLMGSSPVFKAMMESDLSESQTGVINVMDISGKTMEIIIHYMYTGRLEETWRSSDTIAEFMYAAGKYQIESLLEFLDGKLGCENNWSFDLQTVCDLKDFAEKLSLKKAESKLTEIIFERIKNSKNHEDIVALFGGETDRTD